MAVRLYNEYIKVDPNFIPVFSRNSDRTYPDKWQSFYPHSSFKNILKDIVETLEKSNETKDRSVWMSGAYGTGKTYASFVIKHILEDSIDSITPYFTQNGMETLLARVKGVRAKGRILVVQRSASAGINTQDKLFNAIVESVRRAVSDAGLTYIGAESLSDKVLTILKHPETSAFNFQGAFNKYRGKFTEYNSVDSIIKDLEELDLEDKLGLLDTIIEVAALEGFNWSMSSEEIVDWLEDVRKGNSLSSIVFIWDEFTEYFKNNQNNITGLQEIAQASSRISCYLFLITHSSAGQLIQDKGSKTIIEARFKLDTIELEESTAFKLLGQALRHEADLADEWKHTSDQLWDGVKRGSVDVIKNKDYNIQDDDFRALLPMHPYAAYLLKFIAKDISSNQRTIFQFLSGDYSGDEDKTNFKWFIEHFAFEYGKWNYLTADYLWDYFFKTSNVDLDAAFIQTISHYNNFAPLCDDPTNKQLGDRRRRVLKVTLLLAALQAKNGAEARTGATSLMRPTLVNIKACFAGTPQESTVEQDLNYFASKGIVGKIESAKEVLFVMTSAAIDTERMNQIIDETRSAALKKVKKSQFVSPLSEYLRIIPEQAEPVIQKFIKADYQNNDNGKLRIYFLMYRMKSLLRTIPSDDPRAKDCIVLFETDEESDYKLTIIQKDLDVKLAGNEIDGFRSYLEYWEANPDKPLILHTGNAIHFEKNHFFDDVHVIVTSYDLIRYQYGLPASVFEELGTDNDWNNLVRVIIKEGSFEDACRSTLSINRYSSNLFERWNKYNSFQKWLLWLWSRQQSGKSYEIVAAKACKSSAEYLDNIYCCIIDYLRDDKFEQFYKDRKRILSVMQAVPTEHYWNELSSLNRIDALSCLTCLTDVEQKTIFEIVAEFSYQQRKSVLSILKRVYPSLYYYLQNDEQPNCAGLSTEHEQYFSEYKWLKATDTLTEEFVSKVKRISLEKGASVFQMQSRNHFVSEHYDEHTSILFVDGMGIEYVDYLAHLFSDLDEQQYSVFFDAGFCTLPSVTEINKDFMNGRNTVEPPVRELDELKHANNAHPESLIKQIHILDNLKNRVLGLLVGNTHRIIIAADHGTSRMAVKVRNTEYDNAYPKPDNVGIYKYGRFCEGTEDEPKYPTAINYNERLIFADYSRFVQSGAPIDEIHGGASLEEWIVPIITVERNIGEKPETVEVKPKTTKFKPALGTKQVKVVFSISGKKRQNVSARIKGNSYKCEWADGLYSFTFVPSKADGKLTVKIADGGILGQFDIEIEQGIKKNTNFDI